MQDPAPPSLHDVPPPPSDAAQAQPWRDDEPLPQTRIDSPHHGFLLEGQVLDAGDRAGLVRHLAKIPSIPGVYVPGAEVLAPPEEVPGLLDEYRLEAVRLARRSALWAGLFAAAGVGLLVWSLLRWDLGFRSLPGLVAVFGAAYLVLGLHGIRAAGRVQADVFVRARQGRRHWEWVRRQPAPFTWALGAPLVVVYVCTMADESVLRAALVKPAVWNGEAWRMLTGPMLHAGVYHVWMNVSALFALGRMTEAHATRFHLAAVFLCSVLGGSVLSVLLSPRTSVGASGGVMGLVGFLWMMARLRPRVLPDDFGERMTYAVGATALLGVIGFEFIDNWAHLGGLLAGGGMGWLLLRDGPWERRAGWTMAAAGALSLLILLGAMFGTVVVAWGLAGG